MRPGGPAVAKALEYGGHRHRPVRESQVGFGPARRDGGGLLFRETGEVNQGQAVGDCLRGKSVQDGFELLAAEILLHRHAIAAVRECGGDSLEILLHVRECVAPCFGHSNQQRRAIRGTVSPSP